MADIFFLSKNTFSAPIRLQDQSSGDSHRAKKFFYILKVSLFQWHIDILRAIFWENRESQDTLQKIEFFIILPKHPF